MVNMWRLKPGRARRQGEPPCRYCGDVLLPVESDHVVPVCRGGSDSDENLVIACVSCNRQKGTMLVHEWRAWRISSGMSWPPLASHATDPIHYQNHTCSCEEAHKPWSFVYDGATGYRAHYECPQEGRYSVGWGAMDIAFSDCPCWFCRRMEAPWLQPTLKDPV